MKNQSVPLSEDDSLGRIILKRLANPRTWIYPIIILIFALFVLPRFAKQTSPSNQNSPVRFGSSYGSESKTTDAEGNIHHFAVPAPSPSPTAKE